MEVLYRRIKKSLYEFSIDELCDICETFSLVASSDSSDYHELYELIEPYIFNKLHSLTEANLRQVLSGFKLQEKRVNKEFDITSVLEN